MQQTIKIGFIEAIKKQSEGFRFGNLWRLNDEVLGGIVPILRDDCSVERGYKLMEEVKEKEVYKITDTGNIDKIKIKMIGDTPIFVRSGTAFEGQGTQSRATEVSVIIMPDKTKEKEIIIPARCIHASHHISGGSGFKRHGYVPREVEQSLMANEGQSAVWSSVGSSSVRLCSLSADRSQSRAGSTGMQFMSSGARISDNMINNLKEIKKGKTKIKDIMKKVPCLENQVGAVIFDEKGVYSIESFEHPDSWKAFHENIIEKYEDILSKKAEQSIFELKANVVPKKVSEFLDGLLNCEEKVVYEQDNAKTVSLIGEKCIGEYSAIKNKIIHLLGLRRIKSQQKRGDSSGLRATGLGLVNERGVGNVGPYRSASGGEYRRAREMNTVYNIRQR